MDILRILLLHLMVTYLIAEFVIEYSPIQIDDTNENLKYVGPHPEFVRIRQPFHSSLRINVPEDLFRQTFLCILLSILCLFSCFKCSLCVLQHQPGLNTSQLIPAHGHCVVVTIAQNCDSTTTSNVFCRKIDSSGSGEGKPF